MRHSGRQALRQFGLRGSVQNFSHILQQPVGNAWFRIELQ